MAGNHSTATMAFNESKNISKLFGLNISVDETERLVTFDKGHTFSLPDSDDPRLVRQCILREIVSIAGQRIQLSQIVHEDAPIRQQQECLQVCPSFDDNNFAPYVYDDQGADCVSPARTNDRIDVHLKCIPIGLHPDHRDYGVCAELTLNCAITNPTCRPVIMEIFPRSSLVRNGIHLEGSPRYVAAGGGETVSVRLEFKCHPELQYVYFEKDAPVIGVAMYGVDGSNVRSVSDEEATTNTTTVHSGHCYAIVGPYSVVIQQPNKPTMTTAKTIRISGTQLVWVSDDIIEMGRDENGFMSGETEPTVMNVTSGQFDNGFLGEGCIGLTIDKVNIKMTRRKCPTDKCYSGQYQLK